jgi:hypothetical protein
MTRTQLGRLALTGLIVLGLVLLSLELHSRADELDRVDPPAALALAGAAACALVGQIGFGVAWDRLVPGVDDHAALAWSFHGSQPAKYVPLGVAQPIGQIGLLRAFGPTSGAGAVVWLSQILAIVSAGALLGAGLALFDGDAPTRLVLALGVIGPLLMFRPVQVASLSLLRRLSRRVPAESAVPGQRALLEALGFSTVALFLHGSAFAFIAADAGGEFARLVLAYALAASLSTATPLPAGLGVREALIVATAGIAASAALTSALLMRVVLLAVELVLFGGSYVLFRSRSPLASSRAGPG